MAKRVDHQEVVSQLLESKAVSFDAIGSTIAKLGPQLVMTDEPWESFCLTMRIMIWVYRFPGPRGPIFDDLGELRRQAGELQG
jgi:hypothetical protein